MQHNLTPWVVFTVVSALAVLGVAGGSTTLADKGGCPNAASSNGAAHANPNSAHGPEKQAERDCQAAESPTPTPGSPPTSEPSATPTPEASPTPTELGSTDTPSPTPTPGIVEPTETATPTATSSEPTPSTTPTPSATPEPTAEPTESPAAG
jgi:hypothetical protein